MIALLFLLTLCIYANMAQLVDIDDFMDDKETSAKHVMGVRFLKDSIEPLMKDNFVNLLFVFDYCTNTNLSDIEDPSYILVHQAACGKITGVRLDFSDENFLFEFLIQLQKLMLSK